jgi:pleiotropic regulator 1
MNIQKPISKPDSATAPSTAKKGLIPPMRPSAVRPRDLQTKIDEPKSIENVSVPDIPTVTVGASHEISLMSSSSLILALQKKSKAPKMQWRRPWKLHRVIQGHTGWVRAVDVDPSNDWFATGATDRLIKIWDLASGTLRLTLTGHTHSVRAIRVHPRFKYLFSAGEDNMVKCWDLEQNKVIRHYHGHLSGVYCMDVHPEESLLFTGSRDSSVRMWDIRTRNCIHILGGHTQTVQSLVAQNSAPELISGSSDQTVRLWDIRMGRSLKTLTHHHKGIRAISIFPEAGKFATAAPDCVKIWKSPDGDFERNLEDHGNVILNCSAIRDDGLYVAGSDSGVLNFWDWDSGKIFQKIESPPQPGSLECENGIFDVRFDMSGQRIITAECDKTIKIYREDELALNPNAH